MHELSLTPALAKLCEGRPSASGNRASVLSASLHLSAQSTASVHVRMWR